MQLCELWKHVECVTAVDVVTNHFEQLRILLRIMLFHDDGPKLIAICFDRFQLADCVEQRPFRLPCGLLP